MTARTRRVTLLFAAVVAVSAATATGGLGVAAMDRGMTVHVVDDGDAYLGFAQSATTTNGTTNLTVTVTNRFGTGTTLATVVVATGGQSVDLAADGALGPGEAATGSLGNVTCGAALTVDAGGDGVRVRLARTVECS